VVGQQDADVVAAKHAPAAARASVRHRHRTSIGVRVVGDRDIRADLLGERDDQVDRGTARTITVTLSPALAVAGACASMPEPLSRMIRAVPLAVDAMVPVRRLDWPRKLATNFVAGVR